MGWFTKKRDDGLYRGDAPASAPGLDGVEPTAYQGQTAVRPMDSTTVNPNPYPTTSEPYAAVVENLQQLFGQPQHHHPQNTQQQNYQQPNYQAQVPGQPPSSQPTGYGPQVQVGAAQPGQTPPFAAGQPPVNHVPDQLAAVMKLALQQRTVKRTVGRSLFGLILTLLLVGGLVVGGFVVFDNVRDEFTNPFGSGTAAPDQPYQGVVGEPGEVTLGDNSYRITISKAAIEPSAAWGNFSAPVSGGFLLIELSLTRTDTQPSASQISWFDWTFTDDAGVVAEGALIAGGYEPLLSTLNLAPDETATGLVAFDTSASVGTLALKTYDGPWAQWPISATTSAAVAGEFGVPVHPEAARTPFTVTLANPRWIGAGDPAAIFDPVSGSYLVVDASVVLDEGVLGPTSSLSIGYGNWQFTPDGGTAVDSDFGVTGTSSVTFGQGQPTTVNTVIAFDDPRGPGTLALVNSDGSVLATWQVLG